MIPVKAVTARPQVAIWQREVPKGEGITGLWRPEAAAEPSLPSMGDSLFSLKQEGSKLSGTVEGVGANFFGGGDVPISISEGNIEGTNVTFKAGNNSFSGNVRGDRIELQRSAPPPFAAPVVEKSPGAPDIGPAPDGSDPSRGPIRPPSTLRVVLRRVQG
jgi:beta-galactosidase